jgi:hypothetical protein
MANANARHHAEYGCPFIRRGSYILKAEEPPSGGTPDQAIVHFGSGNPVEGLYLEFGI